MSVCWMLAVQQDGCILDTHMIFKLNCNMITVTLATHMSKALLALGIGQRDGLSISYNP